MTHQQLARRIAEVSLLRGDFVLRSGRRSNYYLDKYRFETQPDVLRALGSLFAARLGPDVDRIAGPELGAVSLAAAASMESGIPFVIVRNKKKDYGSAKAVEGLLKAGDKVVVVEDIMTTGGQVIEACKSLEAEGVTIVKIIGVIDRLEGARENIEGAGYVFESLFTTKDLGLA